ncbi:MAG TPA: tRNA pseudouridine(55) synthase TruB [Verrucomicrobiae bacterium]|nr:tRNA pseudouridine(55) synthase TruB [Verrucomicrobiae bacterium]
MDGVLVIDKPAGPTSHDVVAAIRPFVRPARVGHTGTLDPAATGALALCIGAATRLARFLAGEVKRYSGEITLGATTDTYDGSGRVMDRAPIDGITRKMVAEAAASFLGTSHQAPPPWSAKKVAGKRAYHLARRGEPAALAPCAVRIDRFDILGLEEGRASFEVVCSGGTYVRSLAHDIGRRLGCGAHLAALRRSSTGAFGVGDALSLEAAVQAGAAGSLSAHVLPLESLDLGIGTARLTERGASLASAGRVVEASDLEGTPDLVPGSFLRLLACDGSVLGVAEVSEVGRPSLQPRIILSREVS